ncbi:hypothetical protein VR010_03540 [Actinomycetaceae bacterium L2_0104]
MTSNPFSSGTEAEYSLPGYPQSGREFSVRPRASVLQRVIAMLAWPMLFIGPLWFAFGHTVLNGGGGWMVFIGMLFFAPIHAVVAFIHAILVTLHARRLGQWAAGAWSSAAAVVFYVLTAIYPFTVADFGDTAPGIPSRLTVWFGVSESLSGLITFSLLYLLGAIAFLMIVADIGDLAKLKRTFDPSRSVPAAPPGYPDGDTRLSRQGF